MDGLTIGERLEGLIIENGKTLQAVSDEIKDKYGFTIAKSTLSKTINNKSIPQGKTIIYLSKYFNVSADYLLGLTDIKTTDIDFKAVCDYTGLNEKAKKQSDEVIHFEVSVDKKQLNTAIQNVAKRLIPAKPKGDYHSVPHYRCPNCNCSVKLYEDSEVYPYCRWCGQALDWKEK